MATGERIHYFRTKLGMTQKYLGQIIGFPEKSADVRLAQYESGSRTPKADLTAALAEKLEVSPSALNVPDIDSYIGLMHTLFALEDIYGLKVAEIDGEVCLRVNVRQGKEAAELHKMLCSWQQAAHMLENGTITEEEYNQWRYHYPEYDKSRIWAKAPSKELTDILVDEKNKRGGTL